MTEIVGAERATERPDRMAWLTLAITGSAFFVVSLDVTIVSLAFPEIAADFDGTSLATLSWIATGYNIALAALFLVSGRLADVRGRRRTFVAGMAIFVVTSVLAGPPTPGSSSPPGSCRAPVARC